MMSRGKWGGKDKEEGEERILIGQVKRENSRRDSLLEVGNKYYSLFSYLYILIFQVKLKKTPQVILNLHVFD